MLQFANANASGGIASTTAKFLTATFSWGVTLEQIAGMGDSTCINNIQGWIQKVAPPVLTLEMLYDSDKLDDFDGTNPNKYIGIIQKGASATAPAIGLFMPNAYQIEKPETDHWGNNEHRVTVKYAGRPAGYDSETSEGDQGNQTFYFAIADQSA